MVTFDHREAGTPQAEWRASSRWSAVDPLDAAHITRLIVVAAHPDDETLGAAGLMTRVARAGGQVSVVLATDGEASHPLSPTHTPGQLGERRSREVAHAVEMLAPGSFVTRLGLPDGALKYHTAALRAGIEAAIAGCEGPVTLAVPWRGDGHGDHRVVGEVAAEIAREMGVDLLEYPIWLWHWSTPDDPRMPWENLRTLALSPEEHAAKKQAMALHASQTEPLSSASGDEILLREEFLEHFTRPVEVYVRAEARAEPSSLTRKFFDEFYAGRTDPWGFESRWYEQRKRAITMASLPRERFHRALEVGCSIGVLTEQLAARCNYVLATDIAAQPLGVARERLSAQPHVEFRQMAAQDQWPSGSFDLIVLSEVGYYLSFDELALLIRRVAGSLSAEGVLVACHWRHLVQDYPLSGDEVHALIQKDPSLARLLRHEEEDFVLEVFSPPPAISVARETGLI